MRKKCLFALSIIGLFFLFTPNVYASEIIENCGDIPVKVGNISRFIFNLIKYAVPVIIIVIGSIDVVKYIVSSDNDMLSKAIKDFSKKLIAGVLVFLLLFVFQTVTKVFSKSGNIAECMSCFLVSKEYCEYISEEEETEKPVTEGVKDNQTEFDDFTGSGNNSTTLSDEEIKKLIESLPSGLSAKRRKILETALSAVGKIPYYYGGAATKPGFEGNDFGATIASDMRGRTKKGLDCSHYVDWVFWTAIDDNLGNGTTTTLWNKSESIDKKQLKVGDLGFLNTASYTATSNHVGIYAGNDLWVHENGTASNVSVGEYHSFKYFRRVIKD